MTENSIENKPKGRCASWLCWLGNACILCAAFSLLLAALLVSVLAFGLKVPLGADTITIRSLIVGAYFAAILPMIAFAAEILKSFFPWPAVALAGIALIIWASDRVVQVLSSIGKLKLPGGFELEGRGGEPPATYKKEVNEAAKSVDRANKEVKDAYHGARIYAQQLRDRHDIPRLVAELARRIAEDVGDGCPEDYRLTLYVPDFLFEDRLYQFVEYYDKRGERISSNKVGRTFSIRYGIIGRVWRSGVPEVEGDLISSANRKRLEGKPESEVERFIARRWGLSLEEAIRIKPYNSYGAIRIDRAEKRLAVVYFDSKVRMAFGETDAKLSDIQHIVANSRLVGALLEISSEVAPWSGRFRIFENA